MFRLFTSGLLTAAIVAIAPSAQATTISAFDLVQMARQGYLNAIPNASLFDSEVRRGQITAEDLISQAIAQNYLPADANTNQTYINAVELQLESSVTAGQ